MQRIRFIDRMASGKISRRSMLRQAGAFGVGLMALPRLPQAAEVLTCLEWAGYDSPDYFKSYVGKHGGAPNFSIFSGEEDALAKVLAGFKADVMHPCNYSVGRFVNAKVASEIDTSKLSNWKDVFPALQTASGVVMDGKVVMAPADWGNSSIAYRPDLVDAEFQKNESWGIFFDDKYAGKISMLDNELAIAIGMMVGGESYEKAVWASGDKLAAAAKDWGVKVVKNSRFLWNDPSELQQGLASGEIVAAYAWNDVYKNLKREGVPISYARPKEGYFTWFCGLTLLKTGKADPALAYDFIDAWLSPETGKQLIEGSGYGHANMKSFEIADKQAIADMGISDPAEHMKDGTLFIQVSDEVQTAWNKAWGDLKALKQIGPALPPIFRRRPAWLIGYGLLSPALAIMAAMLVAPLLAMVVLSFWTQQGFDLDRTLTLANYSALIEPSSEPTLWMGISFPLKYPVPAILLVKSIAMSLLVTIAVIAMAYPMAYFLAFRVQSNKALWLVLLTIPFWTSYLLRVFAWKIVLGFNGAINSGLKSLGLIGEPLSFLLYNPLAVIITLVHAWIAFAVLPIFVSLEKIDRSLLEAATDLGDSKLRRFLQVTLPLSAPGTIGAALLVFIPTVGDYVTPTLVGGPSGTMIGNLIQELFLRQNNAPLGAAVSITMMLVIGAIVGLFLWLIGFHRLRSRVR